MHTRASCARKALRSRNCTGCVATTGNPRSPATPAVAWRGGIELNPVDVTDAAAVAWLETCIWPEQQERRARLRAAVEIARVEPPRIARGDLFDFLAEQVRTAREHGPVVLFHSAVAMYLDRVGRQRFGAPSCGARQWATLVRSTPAADPPTAHPAAPPGRSSFRAVG